MPPQDALAKIRAELADIQYCSAAFRFPGAIPDEAIVVRPCLGNPREPRRPRLAGNVGAVQS
jgi:hypothetical protein